jgi:acetate kinase
MTEPLVGVINAGSSSLKFSFYAGDTRILSGQVDGIGVHPRAKAVGAHGDAIASPDLGTPPPETPGDVLAALLPWGKERLQGRKLDVLGHRVVQGGMHH